MKKRKVNILNLILVAILVLEIIVVFGIANQSSFIGKAIKGIERGGFEEPKEITVPIEGYLSVATLKKNYSIGERVELTDPPEAENTGSSGGSGKVITMTYDFSKPIIEKKNDYDSVRIEDLVSVGAPGEPVLPVRMAKILLPPGKKDIINIEVIPKQRVLLGSGFVIEPGQESRPITCYSNADCPKGPTLPNPDIYNSMDLYPGRIHSEPSIQNLKGYSIAFIRLYPVQYAPATGELYYYKEIEIKITVPSDSFIDSFLKSIGAKTEKIVSYRNLDDDRKHVERVVDNFQDISEYTRIAEPVRDEGQSSNFITNIFRGLTGAVVAETTSFTYDYIIIAPNEYYNEFNRLARWKRNRSVDNITAVVVTLESILNNPDYYCDGPVAFAWDCVFDFDCGCGYSGSSFNDSQAIIRNFIRYAYWNWNTKYILLGGDSDNAGMINNGETEGPQIIPHRNFVVASENIPADLYYADLHGTFDCNEMYGERCYGNGLFGEWDDVSGSAFTAEVYVGRAPVDSKEEVDNFVTKTIDHENDSMHIGENFYLYKAMMIGERVGWQGEEADWGANYKNKIRFNTWLPYYTDGLVPEYRLIVDTMYKKDYLWTKEDVVQAIESELQILNHMGHGNTTDAMEISITDVDNLNNEEYMFVYSQSCFSAAFDNKNPDGGFLSFDSLAEHFVTSEKGAFAYLGNSRYGYYAEIATDAPSQRYDRQFWNAVTQENITNIGLANQWSKEENYRLGYIDDSSPNMLKVYYGLNLLGDPETSFYVIPLGPENHSITALEIFVPKLRPTVPNELKVQIMNTGFNDESDIRIDLFVDGVFTNTENVSFLAMNENVTVGGFYWTPTGLEGEAEIKFHVHPVPEEQYLLDNNVSKMVYVPTAYVKNVVSEDVRDTDGDGFNNYFDVGVKIKVSKPGTYKLSAYLNATGCKNLTTGVSKCYASNMSTFSSSGYYNVTLPFSGYDINKYQAESYEGIYLIYMLELHDLGLSDYYNFFVFDPLAEGYYDWSTYYPGNYNWYDFDPMPAYFNSSYYDYAVSEGVYNESLVLGVGVNAVEAGTYIITGVLAHNNSVDGSNITLSSPFFGMGIEEKNIDLTISALDVFNSKVKGNFLVYNLSISEGNELIEEKCCNIYETGYYDFRDFVVSDVCGDANGDNETSVSDVVYLINYLFKGGPGAKCTPTPGCANVDGTGDISVSDVVYFVNYLFKSGPNLTCSSTGQTFGSGSSGFSDSSSNPDGTLSLGISMSNDNAVAGTQIEVSYDANEFEIKPELTQRSSNMELYYKYEEGEMVIGLLTFNGSGTIAEGSDDIVNLNVRPLITSADINNIVINEVDAIDTQSRTLEMSIEETEIETPKTMSLPKSLINNTGFNEIKGYLLMKVQKFNGSWIDYEIIIDEEVERIIRDKEYLALDKIWNPIGFVTSEAGTYRVYAAFKDEDGVIETNSRVKLEYSYEFYVG